MLMKILIVTPIFPPEVGGPATYTLEVSRRLRERGCQIRVVTFADIKPGVEDIEIIPVRLNYKIFGTISRQVRLFFTTLFASKGMELLYAQDPMVVGLCSLIVGKMVRKPIILRVGGDAIWESDFASGRTNKNLEDFLQSSDMGTVSKIQFSLRRFVFGQIDKIIVPSYFLKEILVKYYKVNPVKIRVIHNAVDLRDYQRVANESPHPFGKHIITIGRLIRLKRIDRIIEAVSELADIFPRLCLSVVGEGPERGKLEKLSKELKINNQVKFHGGVSHGETVKLLQEADLFILNSVSEGLPHTAIEAMACGTPVITANARGTNEVVNDGKTGLLVYLDSVEELKDKIIQLLEDESLRKKLAGNAYRSVMGKFTWERNLGILEEELKKVI